MSDVTTANLKPLEEVQAGLEKVAFKLLVDEPFYGHILSGVNQKVVDNPKQKECSELKNLGISTVTLDMAYHLWEPLTMNDKVLRLKHEMIHYIFMHPWANRPKDIGLYYIACDLNVNMYVSDKQSLSLNNYDKLSSKYNFPLNTDGGWESIYKGLDEMYKCVPDLVDEDDIPEYIAQALAGDWFEDDGISLKESIFFLPKNPEGNMNISGIMSELMDMMDPDSGSGAASPEEIEEFLMEQAANPSDPWEGVQEGTSSLGAEALINRCLTDAKARGDVPGNLSDYVDMFLSPPRVDWKRELRRFTSLMGDVRSSSTMTRRSKRYGTFPAFKIRRTQRVAICVDTSGSVSEEEFQAFISELRGTLQANCQVIFIQADALVDKVDIYDKTLPEIARFQRWGGGGTSFDDALEYIKTQGRLEKHNEHPNIEKVDGVIYMTDGWAPSPQKENLPMTKLLWLTTQKKVNQMEEEGFTGKIVFLDLDE